MLFFKRSLEQARLRNPIRVVHDVDQAISYLEGTAPFADCGEFPLPTIVFMDLHIPGKDGFELLKWLGAGRDSATCMWLP